jgi:hypothetical protein
MLKKICGLFLGLIVCMGSACVTPTHASSADQVIITYIQASGESGAKDELIVLHNNSPLEVEVTDWCLGNKSAVLFACFTSEYDDVLVQSFIPPYGDVTIASEEYIASSLLSPDTFSYVYPVTSQSSGSIVNGGDTVSLFDDTGEVVGVKTWASAIPTGKALARVKIMSAPDIYATNNDTSDWVTASRIVPPEDTLIVYETPIEIPEEETPPTGTSLPPIITEIFANPAGPDAGKEFIELYNPNDTALSLAPFALHVGVSTVKVHAFPTDASIPARSYRAFSNQEISYTLVNTTGRVQLFKVEAAAGDPVEYTDPKDDYAWAFINGDWYYTKNKTPGAVNALGEEGGSVSGKTAEEDTRKPCKANQYRNPATGRCKLLVTASSTRKPCKANQVRNPETQRCRLISAATKGPAPCKEGQERNAETNRCRKIVKMSDAGHGVLGVQSKADAALQWYYWATIILIIALILAYGVWEWRQELGDLWSRVRARFARRSN